MMNHDFSLCCRNKEHGFTHFLTHRHLVHGEGSLEVHAVERHDDAVSVTRVVLPHPHVLLA